MNGHEMMERLVEMMGKENLFDELMIALSDDELKDNAKWIARMYDVERIFEENN